MAPFGLPLFRLCLTPGTSASPRGPKGDCVLEIMSSIEIPLKTCFAGILVCFGSRHAPDSCETLLDGTEQSQTLPDHTKQN